MLYYFRTFISYLILSKELYRHHLLALFLGLIDAIIVNGCRFPLGFSKVEEFHFHLMNIFLSSLYSLALVLIKYIFTNYDIFTPYSLLFSEGIFSIIISILITLLEYFIVPKLHKVEGEYKGNYFSENFIGIFSLLKGQEGNFYLSFFISMICSFCYYICNIFVIYKYSPFLIVLVDVIIPIDSDILDHLLFKTQNDHIPSEILKRFGIQLIGYVIFFFASLILNEIIILNFCGFSKNIYLNILKRSQEDTEDLIIVFIPFFSEDKIILI